MLYLTLRQYEYITAIARHGSLSAAADVLNVSQPALSVALSRIESHLGQTLFLRRRGAALTATPQGRDFVARAEAVLAQAADLENPDGDARPAQSLTLACFYDLAPFALAPALSALKAHMPHMDVHYRVGQFQDLIDALLQGQADLALTFDLGLDAGFDRHVLHHLTPHVLVPPDHPLTRARDVMLADVARYPLILSSEGLSARHVLGLFQTRTLRPLIAHRAAALEIMRSLAAHGEGVGISYSTPPGHHSYDGKPLVALPISETDAREPVILTRLGTGAMMPAVAEAMTALRDLRIGTAPPV